MKSRLFCFLTSLCFLLFASTSTVQAVTTPSFPSCLNQQGTLKADYSSGIHGIVGRTETYSGSDKVFTLNESSLLQCYCGEDGKGIQTDWWKIDNLSDQDINSLKLQGWFYVPSGAAWGLEDAPYMARNSEYSCDGGTGGLALGASYQRLASTGGSGIIYTLVTIGIASLLISFKLRKRSRI